MPQDLHTMISSFTFFFCKPIMRFHPYILYCRLSDRISPSDTSCTPPPPLPGFQMGLLPRRLTFQLWRRSSPPCSTTSAIRSLSPSLKLTAICIVYFLHTMYDVVILIIFHSYYVVTWNFFFTLICAFCTISLNLPISTYFILKFFGWLLRKWKFSNFLQILNCFPWIPIIQIFISADWL